MRFGLKCCSNSSQNALPSIKDRTGTKGRKDNSRKKADLHVEVVRENGEGQGAVSTKGSTRCICIRPTWGSTCNPTSKANDTDLWQAATELDETSIAGQ